MSTHRAHAAKNFSIRASDRHGVTFSRDTSLLALRTPTFPNIVQRLPNLALDLVIDSSQTCCARLTTATAPPVTSESTYEVHQS